MIFGEKSEKVKIHVGKTVIEESDEETLLGIKLDTMFCFKLICSHFAEKEARSCKHYQEFRFS